MNPENLAPIYLDNQPITLRDPKPKLSAVLSASGKKDVTDVKWLQFQPNTPGKTVRAEEVLDRTSEPNKPIYLTSNKGQIGQSGQSGMEAGKGRDPAVQHGAGAKTEGFGARKTGAAEEGAEEGAEEETGAADTHRQGEHHTGREAGGKPRDE